MSVALRGSPRGSLGTLRRTASLEFFLDMDKECAVEEVELDTLVTVVDAAAFLDAYGETQSIARRPDLVGLPWAGPSDGGAGPRA